MFWLWKYYVCVRAHVYMHVCVLQLLAPPHPYSLPQWQGAPAIYRTCYIIIAAAFCYLSINNYFWTPGSGFPPLGGAGMMLLETSKRPVHP